MKNFTSEEHLKKKKVGKETETNEKKQEDIKEETKEESKKRNDSDDGVNNRIFVKEDSYYEYELVGVLVHSGVAEAGHYYSFINTKRSGNENTMNFDRQKDGNEWIKFDDSMISSFNIKNLEEECFGGSNKTDSNGGTNAGWAMSTAASAAAGTSSSNYGFSDEISKSAYMLVYERKEKCPIKYVAKTDELSVKNFNEESIIKRNNENKDALNKEFNYFNILTSLECDNTAQSRRRQICDKMFYDEEKKEYFFYKDFYNQENSVLKVYYDEVHKDNYLFMNDQRIYSTQFSNFVEKLLKNILTNINSNEVDKGIRLKTLIANFDYLAHILINIISKSNFKDVSSLISYLDIN